MTPSLCFDHISIILFTKELLTPGEDLRTIDYREIGELSEPSQEYQ